MAILEVRGLEKWYGRRQVVSGVDYDVERGEVVGLLGPNGAGKTTSFRMTIGLIDSDSGRVNFDGRDVTRLPMYQRAAYQCLSPALGGRQSDGHPRDPPEHDA